MGMCEDPEESSFRKAMNVAEGVVLILDASATSFSRIWCDFEIYTTLLDEKPLDVVAMISSHSPHCQSKRTPQVLSQNPLPHETSHIKVLREQVFPTKLLHAGIYVKLEEGSASIASDKEQILNIMSRPYSKLSAEANENALDMAVRRANGALNSYFALAAWPRAVRRGNVRDFDAKNPGQLNLAEVLRKDHARRTLSLSLGHVLETDDAEVRCLASALPPNLVELQLCFEGCHKITDAGVAALAEKIPSGLVRLHFDFLACLNLTDRSLEALADRIPSGLLNLRLDFASCNLITSRGLHILAKALPPKLHIFFGTFKGTQCDRNFESLSALQAMAK